MRQPYHPCCEGNDVDPYPTSGSRFRLIPEFELRRSSVVLSGAPACIRHLKPCALELEIARSPLHRPAHICRAAISQGECDPRPRSFPLRSIRWPSCDLLNCFGVLARIIWGPIRPVSLNNSLIFFVVSRCDYCDEILRLAGGLGEH